MHVMMCANDSPSEEREARGLFVAAAIASLVLRAAAGRCAV